MKGKFSWDLFHELPVIGILRGFQAATVERLVDAALRGGLKNIEVTMNSEDAPGLLQLIQKRSGSAMNVGAGTVCTLEDMEAALGAGAEFVVTPVLIPDVISGCRKRQIPVISGAFTPTEIYRAWELGADLVKIFPADQLGPAYIKNVKAPFPQVRLVPTGGVTVETLPEYKRAGADGYGVGSPLFAKARVEEGDWRWVEEQAGRFVEAFRRS